MHTFTKLRSKSTTTPHHRNSQPFILQSIKLMLTQPTQWTTLLVTTLLLLLPGKEALGANLIKNGDFEQFDYTSGSYTGYNSATIPEEFSWSISEHLYLINSYWRGVSGTNNPDGFDQTVELGTPNSTLYQAFTTEVGKTYELSFWYAHDPGNRQGFGIGHVNLLGNNSLLSSTLFHDTPSSRANLKFLPYVSQFTADSEQTVLSFKGDARNAGHGLVIDAVSVVEVTETEATDIPEPSAVLGLLALSGCSFGMLRRRKA